MSDDNNSLTYKLSISSAGRRGGATLAPNSESSDIIRWDDITSWDDSMTVRNCKWNAVGCDLNFDLSWPCQWLQYLIIANIQEFLTGCQLFLNYQNEEFTRNQ
jgi:hypothetical protein